MLSLSFIVRRKPEKFTNLVQTYVSENAFLLGGCAVAALLVSGGLGFGVDALKKRWKQKKTDAARFGGLKEARRAHLLMNPKLACSGIPVGTLGRRILCWIGEEPIVVSGGTRSGKGIGVIRPACLTYGGPLLAYDGGKGELFRTTAGYRARFSHVLNLDLTNVNGAHFNFLDEIDRENPVAGADNLAMAVPRPANSDAYFESKGEELLAAIILHVLFGEPDEKKNMGEVLRILSMGDKGLQHVAKAAAHPVAVERVSVLFGGDPFSEKGGDNAKHRNLVVGSITGRLKPFSDPVVAQVTSRSDFRLADLSRLSPSKRPTTLYLTTPASEDDRLRPVVSLFLAMFMNNVMKTNPAEQGEPKTLIVADEFASLRMLILETAITKIVGCGANMLFGVQSLNAFSKDPYGHDNMFEDNFRCRVLFASESEKTQRSISQSCGTVTEKRKSVSYSRIPGQLGYSRSESETDVEVPVITPGGVGQLEDEYAIIKIRGRRPIRATKIVDFQHPILSKRLNLPVPPMRGADGVYPNLPHPERSSPWAGVLVRQEVPPEPAEPEGPQPVKLKLKKAPPRATKIKLIEAE